MPREERYDALPHAVALFEALDRCGALSARGEYLSLAMVALLSRSVTRDRAIGVRERARLRRGAASYADGSWRSQPPSCLISLSIVSEAEAGTRGIHVNLVYNSLAPLHHFAPPTRALHEPEKCPIQRDSG